jgi:hypothetical protein
MILHVLEAHYEHDYTLRVRFNDGAEGLVDLADELYGGMLAPSATPTSSGPSALTPNLRPSSGTTAPTWPPSSSATASLCLRDPPIPPATRRHRAPFAYAGQAPEAPAWGRRLCAAFAARFAKLGLAVDTPTWPR